MAAADYTSLVQSIYISYFGRPADTFGLASFSAQLNTLKAPTDVNSLTAAYATTPALKTLIDSFGTSAESTALYGTDTLAFVTAIYNNVLNRAPDYSGLVFWVNAINSGNLTKANASLAIMAGASVNTSTQGLIDAQVLANKVSIATNFTTAINTGSALSAYSGNAAAAVARAMLNTVTATTVVATFQATVTATVAQLVTNAIPTQTFVLTTGVDTFSATTTGSNKFVASLDNNGTTADATATLGGADTITGLGANNTLLITDADVAGKDVLPVGAAITNIQTVTLKTAGNAGSSASALFDTTGLTGVTAVNVTSSGIVGDFIKAAATTNVTDISLAANNVTVQGGNNVTITTSGNVTVGATAAAAPAGAVTIMSSGTGTVAVDGGTTVTVIETGSATINIDQVGTTATATTGAITVTDTGATTGAINVGISGETPTGAVVINVTTVEAGTAAAGAITTVGGTTVTINETLGVSTAEAAALAVAGTSAITVTAGAETVTGSAVTTTVNVSQTAAITGVVAVAAVTGVKAVTAVIGVVAAPGVQAVTAVTAVSLVSAVTAVASVVGVTDAAVIVNDVNTASASKAGTITSVTANGYNTITVNDNNLTTLNLANGGNLTVVSNTGSYATPAATLALGLNAVNGIFTDTGAGYTTLSVTTSGAASTLSSITDASLKTLNIAGSQVLTLGTVPSSLTTIAVSGAAGFTGNVSALPGLASFTTTSSGIITTTLTSTTQTFVGSTGQDVITITADATKTITGGSASNNELILNAAATVFTAANTVANVKGFTTLGTNTGSSGSYDLSVLTGFNAIDVQSDTTSATTFTKVTAGTTLALDASVTSAVIYQTADTTGVSDTIGVTIGTANNVTDLTEVSLTLQDANLVGIATVNLVTNDKGSFNTITTLVDNGLSVLNVSGNSGLTIGTLNQASTAATSFTLNNTETGTISTGVTIGTFTDVSLGNLSFTGTGASFITNLNDSASNLTINNSDAAGVTIGTFTDTATAGALSLTLNFAGSGPTKMSSLINTTLNNASPTTTSLTLNDASTGNVTISSIAANSAITSESFNNTGSGKLTISLDNTATATSITLLGNVVYNDTLSRAGSPAVAALATAGSAINIVTTGVTVTGGTDNAHVNLNLGGAGSSYSDNITLGNGNDLVIDGSTLGTVNVTVGTGSNLIILGGTNTTGMYNVTLGSHTATSGIDQINVGTGGTAYGTTANYVVTGAVTGDVVKFTADPASSSAALTVTSTTAAVTVAGAISLIEAALNTSNGHSVAYGVYGGNTYVAETTGSLSASNTTIVELVGVHTLVASTGYVTLAS